MGRLHYVVQRGWVTGQGACVRSWVSIQPVSDSPGYRTQVCLNSQVRMYTGPERKFDVTETRN